MKFKLYFPTGYRNLNKLNDNIDVNVITEDFSVYCATLFTLENVRSLMKSENAIWYWAPDMIIVNDLEMETIKNAIASILADGYLEEAASKIGDVSSVFSNSEFLSALNDWGENASQVISGGWD